MTEEVPRTAECGLVAVGLLKLIPYCSDVSTTMSSDKSSLNVRL